MVVRLSDVQQAFDALLAETRSREEISDWARMLRIANDEGQLTFEPVSLRDKIWRAVTYLEGVDLKDSPTTYLHVLGDFTEFRSRMGI